MDMHPISNNSGTPALNFLAGQTVLAVDCDRLLDPQGPFPMQGPRHCRLSDLDAEFLRHVAPSYVILPLFTAGYDATTAIELLEELGYRGRIVVLAPFLPKPGLVEQELRQVGPSSRLVLITT